MLRNINIAITYMATILFTLGVIPSAAANYSLENLYTIDPVSDSHPLNNHIAWLSDPVGNLKIDDIINRKLTNEFTRNTTSSINLGEPQGASWFFIPVRLAGATDNRSQIQTWQLRLDSMMLAPIDVYIRRSNGEITFERVGDKNYIEQRPIYSPNWVVPIQLRTGETVEVYLKVTSEKPVRFSTELMTSQLLQKKEFQETVFYTLTFSIFLIMIIYSLFAFSTLGGRNHIYFVLFILSMGLVHGSVTGHSQAYLWPNASSWWLLSTPLLGLFSCILASQFSRFFLKTFDHAKPNDMALKANSVIAFISFFISLVIPHNIALVLCLVVSLVTTLTITVSAYQSYRRGYLTARLFLAGWGILLAGQLAYVLVKYDLLPLTLITLNISTICSAVATILLALSLEDQINNRMQGKVQSEQDTREQLEIVNHDLSVALTKLAQSNKVKDQFLATISHELRTPMNGVEGSLDLLKTNNLNPQQLTYVDSARISAREMTSMVDSILRFSEIQSGQIELSEKAFEIRPSLTPIAIRFKHQCQRKGLDFNWYIDKGVPMFITGDNENISLITKHLVDNAIKFTTKGKVTVDIRLKDTETTNGSLQICVNDTGSGIPEDQLSKICNAFYQLDNSYNRRHTGMGIGLAICQQLCNIMGGNLVIESQLGKGTLVTITLPVGISNEKTNDMAPQQVAQYLSDSGRQKTVLVAEDNPVNQLVMNGMLQLLGCYIVTADNGQEVLDILDNQPIDLILMDCQMPIIDGYEATEMIRKSNRHYSDIPIIAVTANAMTGDSHRCLAAGMNDYIKKPISRDILFKKVGHWLKISIESAA